MKRFSFGALVVAALLGVAPAARAQELIYGMRTPNANASAGGLGLVSFSSSSPGTVNSLGLFSNVVAGHDVRSIDFRPATGQMYAISTDGGPEAQLYTVNLSNSALTPVGTGFTLGTNNSVIVEMDFNPVVDRIRVLTGPDGGLTGPNNNFRVNPNGTLVAVDTNTRFAAGDPKANDPPPAIIGSAYTNNFPGATTTTLYAWDNNSDSLVTVGGLNGSPSPNGGEVFTVNEPPNFLTPVAGGLGMDISGTTGTLYVTHAKVDDANIMGLYTRDLTTGAETLIGFYPANTFINDISVPIPVPEPAGVLLAAAAAGLAARRWRRRVAA